MSTQQVIFHTSDNLLESIDNALIKEAKRKLAYDDYMIEPNYNKNKVKKLIKLQSLICNGMCKIKSHKDLIKELTFLQLKK